MDVWQVLTINYYYEDCTQSTQTGKYYLTCHSTQSERLGNTS